MLITESGLLKLTDFGMGKEIKHFGVNAATFALADRGLFMSVSQPFVFGLRELAAFFREISVLPAYKLKAGNE